MSNLLQDGATWLGEQLKQSAGRSVVYSRGTSDSSPITGTLSEMKQEVIDDDGLGTGTFLNDWTFTAADLVVNASQIEHEFEYVLGIKDDTKLIFFDDRHKFLVRNLPITIVVQCCACL